MKMKERNFIFVVAENPRKTMEMSITISYENQQNFQRKHESRKFFLDQLGSRILC